MADLRRIRLLVVSSLLAVTGVATFSPVAVIHAAPLPVRPLIAGGDRHTLVLSGDGILWTFGENFSGQLGTIVNDNNEDPNPIPTQVMTDVVEVAAGAYHSMALKSDGTLWTFGDNSYGQLGKTANSGTNLANPTPTQVMTDVVSIAAGGYFSMALKSDGSLWTFGYNEDGELGNGTSNLVPNPTPTQVMENIGVIAAGAFHALALGTDGALWSFGFNFDGQLGFEDTAGEFDPNPTPTQVLTGIKSIGAGDYHSLAINVDDDLLTFGYNYFGELGSTTGNLDPNADPNWLPTEVISGGVKAVRGGAYHSMVLKTDNTLWTFGWNYDGQLGRSANIGEIAANPTPTQVLTGVDNIGGAGAAHSLVFVGGELLSFGSNLFGQLGRPTNSGEDLANPTPTIVIPPEFRPLVPRRLMDTRPGTSTVDGTFQGGGLRGANTTTQLQVTGRGGIAPVGAAVVLNITATGALGNGYVTAYPCGSAQPNSSNLNYRAGFTTPNLVIAQVGVGGKVCLFTSNSTHLIVDVTGFYPILPTFASVPPARLMDTRIPPGATVDGDYRGAGLTTANSITELKVTERGDVPIDALAVVLNVTAAGAPSGGYVTVYPCGSPVPNASNINFIANTAVPNLVITKVGTDGKVCLFTSKGTNLLVDVAGYFPATSSYESLVPERLMDSRPGASATVDGAFQGIGQRTGGSTTHLEVADRGSVPDDADTVVLNVTVSGAAATGFITVYPCGESRPTASNLNYTAGVAIANLVISKVGTSGEVCIYTSQATHVIVDVDGFYAATS